MAKEKKMLIVGIISTIVLLALFLVIKGMPNKKNKDINIDKSFSIYNVDSNFISNIHVKNSTSEYNIKIENSNDTKTYSIDTLDASCKLSKPKIDATINALSNISSEKLVEEECEDLNKFGLSSPTANLKITLEDGQEKTFYLGNSAPLNSGWYLKIDDEKKVYLIKSRIKSIFLNSANFYEEEQETSDKSKDI